MHLDIWVTFVILEPDVIFGPVLLDKVHLEDEGFEFRTYQNPFDIGDLAYKASGLAVVAGVGVEVRPDAVLQADSFADVDDRVIGIFHQVAAGFCRKCGEDPLQFFGYFHQINCTRIHRSQ